MRNRATAERVRKQSRTDDPQRRLERLEAIALRKGRVTKTKRPDDEMLRLLAYPAWRDERDRARFTRLEITKNAGATTYADVLVTGSAEHQWGTLTDAQRRAFVSLEEFAIAREDFLASRSLERTEESNRRLTIRALQDEQWYVRTRAAERSDESTARIIKRDFGNSELVECVTRWQRDASLPLVQSHYDGVWRLPCENFWECPTFCRLCERIELDAVEWLLRAIGDGLSEVAHAQKSAKKLLAPERAHRLWEIAKSHDPKLEKASQIFQWLDAHRELAEVREFAPLPHKSERLRKDRSTYLLQQRAK